MMIAVSAVAIGFIPEGYNFLGITVPCDHDHLQVSPIHCIPRPRQHTWNTVDAHSFIYSTIYSLIEKIITDPSPDMCQAYCRCY